MGNEVSCKDSIWEYESTYNLIKYYQCNSNIIDSEVCDKDNQNCVENEKKKCLDTYTTSQENIKDMPSICKNKNIFECAEKMGKEKQDIFKRKCLEAVEIFAKEFPDEMRAEQLQNEHGFQVSPLKICNYI